MSEAENYKYPLNPYNTVSLEKFEQYKSSFEGIEIEKLETIIGNKNLCASSSPTTSSSSKPPAPNAPLVNVLASHGTFLDRDGQEKPGLLFKCLAKQKNVLHVDADSPVFARVLHSKFLDVHYTTGNNNDFTQIPNDIIVKIGGDEVNPASTGYLSIERDFPTRIWVYAYEDSNVLKDNKGYFEFVVFLYSELSLQLIGKKLARLKRDSQTG